MLKNLVRVNQIGALTQNPYQRLKPIAFVYIFRDEKPARIDRFLDVSATLKNSNNNEILTFWFRWDHDWEGDGVEDWEPVTYIVEEEKVIDI